MNFGDGEFVELQTMVKSLWTVFEHTISISAWGFGWHGKAPSMSKVKPWQWEEALETPGSSTIKQIVLSITHTFGQVHENVSCYCCFEPLSQ